MSLIWFFVLLNVWLFLDGDEWVVIDVIICFFDKQVIECDGDMLCFKIMELNFGVE